MDRFNQALVDISLSLEDEETIALHQFMMRRMPARKVSDRYKHGNYHTNAEAIVLSNWSYRKPYIMCGTPGFGGAISCCHQTFVCDACCKKAAARMYVRYKDSFHKAQHWYAITYSFTSNVFLDSATQHDYLERFATADRFIKSLRLSGLIQGAVAVKEVSVTSLHARAVFPHTHMVINSDRADLINEDGTLHASILEESQKTGVSLRIVRITDPSVFLYELKYPLKPINIKSLYQEETINHDTNDINLGLDLILGRLTHYTKGKPRIVYYGNMDARCKGYIGTAMNAARKAARKSAATKELNSSSPSSTINLESSNTKVAAPMPLTPPPVLPPQTQAPQKKKNFWGPLALGVGAGAAGLGALDHFLNKGRATTALLNSFKSRLGLSPEPSAAPRPPVAPFRPAQNEAQVMADAAAGTIGSGVNPAAKDAWQKWLAIQKNLAAENTFAGVPGQFTGSSNPGITNPLALLNQEGTLDHIVRNVGSPTSLPLHGAADVASNGLNAAWTLGNLGTDAVLPGTVMAATGIKMLPGVGPILASSPAYGKLLSGLDKAQSAAGRLFFSPAPAVEGAKPALGRVGSILDKFRPSTFARVLGGTGGALQGESLGANPLTIESFMDAFPRLSPQGAATASRLSYAGLGGAGATRLPLVGNAVMGVNNAIADNAVAQLRQLNANVAERGNLGDLMARWYHGARSGSTPHRNALERALKYIDENKGLQQNITGTPAASKWKFWKALSPDTMNAQGWGGDVGSPALQSLINKSRQAILE